MSDQRAQERLPDRSTVLVTLLKVPSTPALAGRILNCRACDVSLTGLRINLDLPLHRGDLLHLGIAVMPTLRVFEMMGMVRWCLQPMVGEGYHVGVQFIEGGDVDTPAWRTCIRDKIDAARLQKKDTPRGRPDNPKALATDAATSKKP